MSRAAICRLASLTLAALATATLNGQTIKLEADVVDFGNIKDNEKPSRRLFVKNTGDKLLKITHINTTCGCTLGKMDTPESLQMLRKMADDNNEIVRNEALRYIEMRSKREE